MSSFKTRFLLVFSIALSVVSSSLLGCLWCKVRAFDRKHGCDVVAGLSSDDILQRGSDAFLAEAQARLCTTNISTYTVQKGDDVIAIAIKQGVAPSVILELNHLAQGEKLEVGRHLIVPKRSRVEVDSRAQSARCSGETNKLAAVKSVRFLYDEEAGTIEVGFNKRPCADDLSRGIQVRPKVEAVSWDVEEGYDWSVGSDHKRYFVRLTSANFKFRQPYEVRVKRDLRFEDGFALDGECRKSVERPDLKPSVSLAHAGRYLPAAGERQLALESVNVARIDCSAWRVIPENIVQLLAREERQYTESIGYWSGVDGDSLATAELSSAPFKWHVQPVNKLNETARTFTSLQMEGGVVTNGVYLMGVGNGDREENERAAARRGEYRLVCVTDIGLSVRRDRQGLRAWVTSLSTGRPLANLSVRLYASNRLLLADRRTDARGEVALAGWDKRYEPFALVVARPDGSDATFMAVRDSMAIDETLPNGNRPDYLEARACQAFVWTERGIYRHREKIMTHVILRNGEGNAPRPFPVRVVLVDDEGDVVSAVSALPDAFGALQTDAFSAPDNRPSGKWKIKVLIPGKKEILLGEREVKIEEFVPPQIRVKLRNLPVATTPVTGIVYTVAAEHLFGGPARKVTAESLVAFTDAPFAPAGWNGFRFGDANRGLKPNYTRLPRVFTDERGEASFAVGLDGKWGEPQAAVRMIVQGSVFETGGRPSVTRESRVLHKYPYYIGSNVPRYIRQKPGAATFRIALVEPDGRAHRAPRALQAKLWKIEHVHNLVREDAGYKWDTQSVKRPVKIDEVVQTGADGMGSVKLPVSGSGDYELSVQDAERGLSHTAAFWISASGDDEVRASLKNPTALALAPDKAVYREGERPRLTLKCPFRGFAWLSVLREKTLYTRVVEVTNLTQVVELDPVDGAWAPNVDVAVSLVQSVTARKNHLACRAHGLVALKIRTRDSDIPVKLGATVKCSDGGGSALKVRIDARGEAATGERAVVTVVDEGINLLTAEPVPDPIGHLALERGGWHPLYDVYARLLPVLDGSPKTHGVKTGGDDLAGMMNRVSPVPTRRFKPLSQWRFDVALANGLGEVDFQLPEFVGEVRITAVAYNRRATGCKALRQKVCPKLVMQPDAPRFAAPGDRFGLTLTLSNRSGGRGEIAYELQAAGAVSLEEAARGRAVLADGDATVLNFRAVAAKAPGQGVITYRARGFGETHVATIELPVRPAVPWEERSEVVLLRPGEQYVSTNAASSRAQADLTRRTLSVSASPVAELRAAFDYLAEYPHGCLEQTTSRMFPLLYDIGHKTNTLQVVKAGVARVVSMLRETDFTMWPDCSCPPWDREVSLYAAHFLVEAGTASAVGLDAKTTDRVCRLLKRWAYDADTNIAAYACHTLALAGRPEKDRLYALYDLRARLPLLARARLARAFIRTGDPRRARELVAGSALDPKDVREAAFALMTLLEADARDPRLAKLVLYLQKHRDRQRFHWGTTLDNAHALLALGAYYQAQGVREGEAKVTVRAGTAESPLAAGAVREVQGGAEIVARNGGSGDAYLAVRQLTLPEAASVGNRQHLVRVSRTFKTSEGFDADMKKLTRGDLLIGEIVLSADREYAFSDLVVQELLPACLEPDRQEVAREYRHVHSHGDASWILRSEARDDRVLAFSRPVTLSTVQTGAKRCVFHYAVRVITPGEFILPGTRVEAMYAPEINAQLAPERICVKP